MPLGLVITGPWSALGARGCSQYAPPGYVASGPAPVRLCDILGGCLLKRTYYYVLLAPISRGTLPCAMHGHAPWLLAGSLHSSPAGAFAGTPRNVLCPLQSVAPCTPLRCLVVVWAFRPRQARPVRSDAWVS